ncbi:hypothetical protein XGA_0965, partial [Xanthomonas hortorum ATCC 19865]
MQCIQIALAARVRCGASVDGRGRGDEGAPDLGTQLGAAAGAVRFGAQGLYSGGQAQWIVQAVLLALQPLRVAGQGGVRHGCGFAQRVPELQRGRVGIRAGVQPGGTVAQAGAVAAQAPAGVDRRGGGGGPGRGGGGGGGRAGGGGAR